MPILNVNKPILDVNSNMAYIIGVLKGDGSVYKTKAGEHSTAYHIKLAVKDKAFVDVFTEAIHAINLSPNMFYDKWSRLWVSDCVSMVFYDWYTSMTRDDLTGIIYQYPLEFIRGFYESEGSFHRMNNRPNSWLLYPATNKDRGLLELLAEILHDKYGFDTSIYISRKKGYDDGYRLYLKGGKTERKRFLDMVKPCIRNKPYIQ